MKRGGKKRFALVLPMTVKDMIEELAKAEDDGSPRDPMATVDTQRCYLCHAGHGDKRVALSNDGATPVELTTVHLSMHRVRMTGDFDLAFLLCLECAALVGLFKHSLQSTGALDDEKGEIPAVSRAKVLSLNR